MAERTLVLAGQNLLARGFVVVATDRRAPDGAPVNALFAVARAVHRVMAFKVPAKAVAVIEAKPDVAAWPPSLCTQLERLPALLRALGLTVVEAEGEAHVVASYARAAHEAGDDVVVVGVDKRFAQLVGERVWWYDANKDVRYTPEIVAKRFDVGPAEVGAWLSLVGDDSGNEVLPGIKGVGAKGAASLVKEHGSIEAAILELDGLEGRLGNALRAARESLPRELARGRLDTDRALPIAIDAPELAYRPLEAGALNAVYEELGFAELLVASVEAEGGGAPRVEVCEASGDVVRALSRLGKDEPIAVHALMDDPAPVRTDLAGLALAIAEGDAFYVPVASAAWADLAAWLADPSAPKIGHDLVAVAAPLRRLGIVLAGVVGDSASASHLTEPSRWAPHDVETVAKHVLGRALPTEDAVRGVGKRRRSWNAMSLGRAAAYAGQIAIASAAIWKKLSPALEPRLVAEYLAIEDVCVRMELTGMLVDLAELDRAEASFAAIEEELEARVFALAGHPFNINSAKQLGTVLFEELALPVAAKTKTGWGVSIEALERIEHAHPIVPLVLRWRALRRLRDNWLIALRRCVDTDGRVHSHFHPARSFSGQIVNSSPDLGRVPGRTAEMERVRRAFVAAPGRLLVSVDFNQLGLHVLAHLTKDPALVEPLRRGADMHALTASAVLEIPVDAVSPEQRQLGKVVNFATFAGQGASALALALGISASEAKEYIARFDRRYAKVRAFQDEQLRLAREEGGIVTIAGRRWPIGGLESLDPLLRSYAERLARRATHEASVQDVARRALVDADRALVSARLDAFPVLQVLDEVLFDVAEAALTEVASVAANAMRRAYQLEVPLVASVWAGRNWADLEPVPLPERSGSR